MIKYHFSYKGFIMPKYIVSETNLNHWNSLLGKFGNIRDIKTTIYLEDMLTTTILITFPFSFLFNNILLIFIFSYIVDIDISGNTFLFFIGVLSFIFSVVFCFYRYKKHENANKTIDEMDSFLKNDNDYNITNEFLALKSLIKINFGIDLSSTHESYFFIPEIKDTVTLTKQDIDSLNQIVDLLNKSVELGLSRNEMIDLLSQLVNSLPLLSFNQYNVKYVGNYIQSTVNKISHIFDLSESDINKLTELLNNKYEKYKKTHFNLHYYYFSSIYSLEELFMIKQRNPDLIFNINVDSFNSWDMLYEYIKTTLNSTNQYLKEKVLNQININETSENDNKSIVKMTVEEKEVMLV